MTHWITTERKARTAHKCSSCCRVIRPGETYMRVVGLDGSAWTWKDCRHCSAVLVRYDIAWDGEYNADTFAEWANDGDARTLDEARAIAGFRKRWQTRSGALWPVPGSPISGPDS